MLSQVIQYVYRFPSLHPGVFLFTLANLQDDIKTAYRNNAILRTVIRAIFANPFLEGIDIAEFFQMALELNGVEQDGEEYKCLMPLELIALAATAVCDEQVYILLLAHTFSHLPGTVCP